VGTFTRPLDVLESELVQAIRAALPLTSLAEEALRSSEQAYRTVAVILVALRHQFRSAGGTKPDLRGRSAGYREVVRKAYLQAGAEGCGPIEKRLTAGVSYWVRKVLVEQYGEERLRDMGVLPAGSFASVAPGDFRRPLELDDPATSLSRMVDLLNRLATDPAFTPPADIVRSAARAVLLLKGKLADGKACDAA